MVLDRFQNVVRLKIKNNTPQFPKSKRAMFLSLITYIYNVGIDDPPSLVECGVSDERTTKKDFEFFKRHLGCYTLP